MRLQQFVVIALCCLINLSEGYDVVSLAYAAPVLTKEWGTPAHILGLVFSASNLGLTLSAFFLAPFADKFGRRSMMLAALVAIMISHAFAAVTNSIYVLLGLRFLMGLGLGILVVSLNVIVSEYANDQRRNFMLSILHVGFTIGMMVGGAAAALVLEPLGWRAIFTVGAVMNAALIAILFVFLWESPSFLIAKQPKNALARLNKILGKLGHQELTELPPPPEKKAGLGVASLLGQDIRSATLLMWVTSLSFAVVGYFLLSWKPTVLVHAGLTPTQASFGGVLEDILGIFGHLTIGLLARKGAEARWTAIYFAFAGVILVIFGNLHAPWQFMILTGAVLKFFTVGAYTGVLLVAISLYSAQARSLVLGFVVGWGRMGAIIGPVIGGLLLGSGTDEARSMTFAVFAAISAIPVLALLLLMRRNAGAAQPAPAPASA
jgi:MFS family permease